MAGSLRDQLLKAGLVDEKKAKQAEKEKRDAQRDRHQANKQAGKQVVQAAAQDARRRAQQAQEERAARDREQNRKKEAAATRKALYAELRQLLQSNAVERKDGEIAYRFRDGDRLEKIYVTDALQSQLARGTLGIARIGKLYVLIPAEVIARLRERDPENITKLFVAIAGGEDKPAADDPYAAFQVPDDLMW